MLTKRVDVHIGHRIQLRRVQLGMSEKYLANVVGATVNELKSWEVGGKRVAASTLLELSTALDVNISYFFEELPEISGDEREGLKQNNDPVENGNH